MFTTAKVLFFFNINKDFFFFLQNDLKKKENVMVRNCFILLSGKK